MLHQCPSCSYSTKYKSNLPKHIRKHTDERPYPCTYPGCTYRSRDASTLATHAARHNENKRFHCDCCDYSSPASGDLHRHQRQKHSHQKPHRCTFPGCEYSCALKHTLTVHKRTHEDIREFPCQHPGCAYSATTSPNLTLHMRGHTGQKPFVCNQSGCQYATGNHSNLVTHKRIHSGDRPYCCQECDFSTPSSSHLARHMLHHSGHRPYPCQHADCGESFPSQGNANRHFRNWHSAEASCRKKKEELRISLALTAAGIAFEPNQRIRVLDGRYREVDFIIKIRSCDIYLEIGKVSC